MTPDRPNAVDATHEAADARTWLGLSLGSLVFAGLFALAVVIGRMPPFDRFVTDPLFFKRCLVAHVNLSLIVFMYGFVVSLLFLFPGRAERRGISRYAIYLAITGMALILIGAGVPDSQPVLANYVPTIDHWLFRLGQALFGLGIFASLLDLRLYLPTKEEERERSKGTIEIPAAARAGLRATACALLLAAITFTIAWFGRPMGVAVDVYYELLAWGGGHVLQLACVLAMVSVWLILLHSALGTSPVSGAAAALLFLALLFPWFLSPALTLSGTQSSTYMGGFTRLMRWGIFPITLIFFLLCMTALVRAWREGTIDGRRVLTDLRLSGFLASSGLTLLGFVLGAFIRESNTMIPAHYHASVGAVTVAFMAITFLLLDAFRIAIPNPMLRRAAAWQPLLYGTGMALFASGFAFAGAHGMGRKMYGVEQASRGLAESLGLAVMGIGGFISIAGGLLFLAIISAAWWRGTELCSQPKQEFCTNSWR